MVAGGEKNIQLKIKQTLCILANYSICTNNNNNSNNFVYNVCIKWLGSDKSL